MVPHCSCPHSWHVNTRFTTFPVRPCFPLAINMQGCDAGAVPEPSEPVYRTAAAAAVNIHPLAKTYEGLVPVSLDAPPPKMKRKGKQVRRSAWFDWACHIYKPDSQNMSRFAPPCSHLAHLCGRRPRTAVDLIDGAYPPGTKSRETVSASKI